MEKKVDILYAEDDRRIANMVKNSLEEHEFQVRVALNGTKAWEAFHCNAPDILLLDLEMPGINGLELVKSVREINMQVPIVFYSSYMDITKELDAIKLGADDCIRKGVPLELLLVKLRSIYHRITRDERNPQIYFLSEATKFNAAAGLLMISGKTIILKSMDARLLQLLCVKMHEVAGNDYLIRGLWGNFGYTEKGNALRKGIIHLRRELEVDNSLFLGNSYGEGYVLTSRQFPV